ncbi:hypothetical protein [Filimonas effusa]|uniref:Uncharacterized protein n=1 Tax=Filimonas effusa TaxID=2508721 RepID=A0A4Q1D384_9BACT|nr:hypothetical protein [Filimonas effusa]RXK81759.1 hypothetical protein ESB13_18375 [Filimonas effusa]
MKMMHNRAFPVALPFGATGSRKRRPEAPEEIVYEEQTTAQSYRIFILKFCAVMIAAKLLLVMAVLTWADREVEKRVAERLQQQQNNLNYYGQK